MAESSSCIDSSDSLPGDMMDSERWMDRFSARVVDADVLLDGG